MRPVVAHFDHIAHTLAVFCGKISKRTHIIPRFVGNAQKRGKIELFQSGIALFFDKFSLRDRKVIDHAALPPLVGHPRQHFI